MPGQQQQQANKESSDGVRAGVRAVRDAEQPVPVQGGRADAGVRGVRGGRGHRVAAGAAVYLFRHRKGRRIMALSTRLQRYTRMNRLRVSRLGPSASAGPTPGCPAQNGGLRPISIKTSV